METFIFATNNTHKATEIRAVTGNLFTLITMREAGIDMDIPEPFDTLEENAREKSRTIYKMTGKNCFSEDTGLETNALAGAPGVKSARYAGEGSSMEDNIQKLLHELVGKDDRKARFRTVVSLQLKGKEYQFEGSCSGTIITEKRGESGFGYDPVFLPDGSSKTFAEMDIAEKNLFSHRKKAIDKLIAFLNKK